MNPELNKYSALGSYAYLGEELANAAGSPEEARLALVKAEEIVKRQKQVLADIGPDETGWSLLAEQLLTAERHAITLLEQMAIQYATELAQTESA